MNRVTCSNMDGYHHNFTIGSWESLISSWSKVAAQISNMMFAIAGKNCRYSLVFSLVAGGINYIKSLLAAARLLPTTKSTKENTFMYQIYQHSFQQQVSSQTSSLSPMPAQNIHLNV